MFRFGILWGKRSVDVFFIIFVSGVFVILASLGFVGWSWSFIRGSLGYFLRLC